MKKFFNKAAFKSYRIIFRNLPSRKPIGIRFRQSAQRFLKIFSTEKNPLTPKNIRVIKGSEVSVELVRNCLSEKDTIGTWTLDDDTMTLLWEILDQIQPQIIIECGSGVSTILLAAYASKASASGNHQPTIISIEQNINSKIGTENKLLDNRLARFVTVIHAPIDERGIYQLDLDKFREVIDGRVADLVLIDGPSGPFGCRASTLPLLSPFCKAGTRWYLDDALRDGEMQVLNEWKQMANMRVEGIYAVGKGLATGTIS